MDTQTKDKLVLGTVQLGLDYGIKNTIGKPPREKAAAILRSAYENGIRTFDTAAAYGNAEEILGEFIAENPRDDIGVISKLRPDALKNIREDETEEIVEKEVRESSDRLGVKILDGYLLHNPEDMYRAEILSALEKLKGKKLARNVGVSIYEEKDALHAVRSGKIDYIQVPYNIFDQRLNQTDFFETAKKNGVKIFARSAFLQGLLLMKKREIPDHLARIQPYFDELDAILQRYDFTRHEAAFLFSYCDPNIDYVVFGVDTPEQLDENIKIIRNEKVKQFEPCFHELKNRFLDIDKTLILPNLWEERSHLVEI